MTKMTLEAARKRAQELSEEGIAEGARSLLADWKAPLNQERGHVPIHLAAVLTWADNALVVSGSPQYLVWRANRPLNEAGLRLTQLFPGMFRVPDSRFWLAATQARGVGATCWSRALRFAGGRPEDVSAWALKGSPEQVNAVAAEAGITPGTLAFRIAVAEKRVKAAERLHGGALTSDGFGLVLGEPAWRRRRNVAKALVGAEVIAGVLVGAYQLGNWALGKRGTDSGTGHGVE